MMLSRTVYELIFTKFSIDILASEVFRNELIYKCIWKQKITDNRSQ